MSFNRITLSDFSAARGGDGVRLSCQIDGVTGKSSLSFDIATRAGAANRITADPAPFVVAMIVPAMERGCDLHILGPMDASLVLKLNDHVIPLLCSFHPFLLPVRVTAETLQDSPTRAGGLGAMTGMSCGVDSLDTFHRYALSDVPRRYRVTSLSVFHVGAFNDETAQAEQAKLGVVVEKSQAIAAENDCAFYVVSGNLAEFYDTSFPQSVSMRNVACAFALADVCDSYLGASSIGLGQFHFAPGKTGPMDLIDPLLCPQFTCDRLEVLNSSVDIDRTDKLLNIIENSQYLDLIDVCTSQSKRREDGKQCGTCAKCGHLLMLMEALGRLEDFGKTFDLSRYRRKRWRLYRKAITHNWYNSGDSTDNYSGDRRLRSLGFQPPRYAAAMGYLGGWIHRHMPYLIRR